MLVCSHLEKNFVTSEMHFSIPGLEEKFVGRMARLPFDGTRLPTYSRHDKK